MKSIYSKVKGILNYRWFVDTNDFKILLFNGISYKLGLVCIREPVRYSRYLQEEATRNNQKH